MGEIVWAKTTEHRDHLSNSRGRVPADTRITVFASRDKVCMVDSTMLVGKNKNSNKCYYEWRSVSSVGFFRNKAGNLQPYKAERSLNQKAWFYRYPKTAFYYLEEEDALAGEPMKAFRDACSEYLNLRSVYDLYPMAEVMGLPERFTLLPSNLRPHMRTRDWSEFMSGAVGKSRVTPGMIDSAKNSEPFLISLASEFRGLVDNARLETFLKNSFFDDNMMEKFQPHTPRVRALLRLMDEDSRISLLSENITFSSSQSIKYASVRFADRMRRKQFYQQPLGKVHSWTHLTCLV